MHVLALFALVVVAGCGIDLCPCENRGRVVFVGHDDSTRKVVARDLFELLRLYIDLGEYAARVRRVGRRD